MESNKLSKLSMQEGMLKGGFSTLTVVQMTKLKGGSGETNSCTVTNTNCPTCTTNRWFCS